ncbi:protein kinase family protein [Nocardioides houyundeii]|uniref:protein kinase family protein n=1 Tax=Nocardioides houyundeii TaxID=2045452 RepID=UPI000DF1DB55|nr:protein kinase family protein [Nocardioides houyundeii]
MPASIHAGDLLAGRYRMVDLLNETEGGWFWCAHDEVLQRQVAVHLIAAGDDREPALMDAARRSAALVDRRNLRVLDADRDDRVCFVVNEWGSGESLDNMLAQQGPLSPRRAAWLVAEVADTLAVAHAAGKAHGRLIPENVLVDENGQVRVIGFAVDAALHALPPHRIAEDVTDLAALLYAALTGKWPSRTPTRVEPAPQVAGHPLRPRQVRAGIPRPLDVLCDVVLSSADDGRPSGLTAGLSGLGHRGTHDLTSAAGIRDALEEFLGAAATGMLPVTGLAPQPAQDQSPSPAVPQRPEHTTTGPSTNGAASPQPSPPAGITELPTEAGMPVFHEGDEDVEWLRARAHRPAPPPPFDTPAERPLFAPDPEEGEPARRPRAPRPAPEGGHYWPWDTSAGHGTGHGTGHGLTGSGSGVLRPVPPAEVPGRGWLRLAMLVGFAALVLLIVVAAYQLGGMSGLGGGDGGSDDDSTAKQETSLSPLTGLVADDFDPQGDPQEEYPELAPLAVDGDPATRWRTSTYDQQFGPGGLKSGVGLVLDLGKPQAVGEVAISVVGGSTDAQVYVTDTAPTSLEGLAPAGTGSDPETITITLDPEVTGQFVTVWLTALPEAAGGFRGEIAEVEVRG